MGPIDSSLLLGRKDTGPTGSALLLVRADLEPIGFAPTLARGGPLPAELSLILVNEEESLLATHPREDPVRRIGGLPLLPPNHLEDRVGEYSAVQRHEGSHSDRVPPDACWFQRCDLHVAYARIERVGEDERIKMPKRGRRWGC